VVLNGLDGDGARAVVLRLDLQLDVLRKPMPRALPGTAV
jgi:hypothetical protein